MQSCFYLLSVQDSQIEVRRIDSAESLSPLLQRLHRGESLESPVLDEYPRHVRRAVENLDKVGGRWLVVPGECEEEFALSEADREFLRGLGELTQESPLKTLFERAVEQTKELLPPSKKGDPEVERIALLVFTECMTRGLLLAESQAVGGPAEPLTEVPSKPTDLGLYASLEIGAEVEARFQGCWDDIQESVERTLQSDYYELITLNLQFVSEFKNPVSFAPRAEPDEIAVYHDGYLRSGARIPAELDDSRSIVACILGMVEWQVADSFHPEMAPRVTEAVRRFVPHTLDMLESLGWTDIELFRLYKAILNRGLPLCPLAIREVCAGLCEFSPGCAPYQLGILLEQSLFHRNCMFAYGATRSSAVELSETAQEEIRNARGSQGLVRLEHLRAERFENRDILIVPPDLCRKARMLFGRWGVTTELAIPEGLEVTITGQIGK